MCNKSRQVFVNILLSISMTMICASTFSEEGAEIDVPGGYFQYLYDAEIQNNGGVSCVVNVVSSEYSEKWASSLLIKLSANEDPNVTQVIYTPEGGYHFFTVRTLDGPNSNTYSSEFLVLKHESNTVHISMFWRKDGVIIYRGQDDNRQQGMGYVINPAQKFEKLSVIASGIKGRVKCDPDNI